jgi:hypothetical protein
MTGLLAAVVAICAFVGGVLLISKPSGHLLGLSPRLLAGSAFHSYLVPGLLLFVVIGLSSTAAAVTQLRGSAHAPLLTAVAGLLLIIWMAVQFAIIGILHPIQPVLLFSGVALELLGAIEGLLSHEAWAYWATA